MEMAGKCFVSTSSLLVFLASEWEIGYSAALPVVSQFSVRAPQLTALKVSDDRMVGGSWHLCLYRCTMSPRSTHP